jgi:hypothetical protein
MFSLIFSPPGSHWGENITQCEIVLRGHSTACRSTSQQQQPLSYPSEHLSRHPNRVAEHTLRGIPAPPPPPQPGGCLFDPLPRPTSVPVLDQSFLQIVTTAHLGMASMPLCPPRRLASRAITIHNNLSLFAIALDSHRGKEDAPCIHYKESLPPGSTLTLGANTPELSLALREYSLELSSSRVLPEEEQTPTLRAAKKKSICTSSLILLRLLHEFAPPSVEREYCLDGEIIFGERQPFGVALR